MSIKIEGGGSKENVFSDSDSGMPLWNGAPLLNLVYPVGSIYWSSNNTNPGTLFGGTWTQIKDKFVLACGDTYNTTGATGGASTVTLSINNMPSHDHRFTPSGNVSSHSHGMASHTHTFTPSGNVSSHSHTLNSGNTSISGTKTTAGFRSVYHKHEGLCGGYNIGYGDSTGNHNALYAVTTESSDKCSGYVKTDQVQVTGYLYGSTDSSTPKFTGTAGTTGKATGYTDSSTPTFSGTSGITSSVGRGTSFSIMPPYIVKYCWERIA